MKITGKIVVVCLVMLTSPSAVWATDMATVRQLMEASGLQYQIDQLPGAIIEGARSQSQDKQFDKAFASIIRSEINTAAISNEVRKGISEQLRSGDAERALNWWRSPLGQYFNEIESKVSTAEGVKAFETWLSNQQGSLASSRYRASLERLDRAVRASEYSAMVGESVAESMLLTLMNGSVSYAQQQQTLEAAKNAVGASAKAYTSAFMAYMYREVRISDLAEYIRFLESPAGQRFQTAASDSLVDAVTVAMKKVSERLAEHIRAEHSRVGDIEG